MKRPILALVAALCLSPAAQAVSLSTSTLNGNELDTSFSTPSLIAFDLTLFNTLPVTLVFDLDEEDINRGSADFNALVREVAGAGIPGLRLTLSGGASFDFVEAPRAASQWGDALTGSVFSASPTDLSLGFVTLAGNPVTETYLGNPLSEDGIPDWHVNLRGLGAGEQFTLTVAVVPEPGEWMLMLAGLGLVGFATRRRG